MASSGWQIPPLTASAFHSRRGGDRDSTHSADVDYAALLPSLFDLVDRDSRARYGHRDRTGHFAARVRSVRPGASGHRSIPGRFGPGSVDCPQLVERYGGTVSVHSDGPGTGSELVVRLKRAIAPVEPEAASDVESARAAATAPTEAVRKVLVVDDSVDATEMLATALSAKGYTTQVAFDAPAALRIAAEFR